MNPLKFYAEAIPRNATRVDITDIHKLYLAEFLNGLQTAINQMSVDNIRISHVTSQGVKVAKYLSDALDADWTQLRGMEIVSVGIQSISYDEESKKLINMRNQGAMLGDPSVREGYVQGAMARGMEAAGSNSGGAMAGFMGMAAGMNAGGGFMGAASAANMQQMQMNRAAEAAPAANTQQAGPASASWTCSCGAVNTGKFCGECGSPRPAQSWTCSCGTVNTGKFCSECGKPRS